MSLASNRVAVEALPTPELDLTHVYRAALSIYWNRSASRLEDRYEREDSYLASFHRLSKAVKSEYGLTLRAVPDLRIEGVSEPDRGLIHKFLHD